MLYRYQLPISLTEKRRTLTLFKVSDDDFDFSQKDIAQHDTHHLTCHKKLEALLPLAPKSSSITLTMMNVFFNPTLYLYAATKKLDSNIKLLLFLLHSNQSVFATLGR
jgi:hypothetical protein